MCEKYLITNHKDDITRILENPEKEKYFAVNINFLELFETDTNLGNELLTEPEVSLKNWNKAVFNVQSDLLKEIDAKYSLKNNISCRIYSLPPWAHICRTVFPGNNDANKFLQVTGTVVRMSARKLLECRRQYICVTCKYPITVEAQYDKRNIIKQPKRCSNPEGCTGKTIIPCGELDTYNCKDYQEIKIQEDLSKLGVGTIPNHMIVTLEDDLVNICKPGENVTITGIVTRRWSEFEKGVKIIIDIAFRANHVQVNNSSGLAIAVSDDLKQFFDNFWERHINKPLIGRNIILRSIAPEIYGLHLVKLAIAIVLAGGSQSEENEMSTGIDKRSESHLLLVGDPGTGKSQMLRFASKIIPRSVLTTGVGSTAAGLTVTAVMENGEWQLEAGALVMAGGGICCIDEFNSMREHDRTSIHEAMEQQTISVAKAGMVCKLKTRCSILAACNPKGNINPAQPLCVNVAMSSPLLSRFDLILLLRDVVNEDNDGRLAEYVLNKGFKLSGDGSLWSLEKLQAYFAVIKKQNPKLTVEAETILSVYYQMQRKFSSRNKSRTTVRLLESMIRLSQGHAKLLYHDEVQVIDAIFAVTLTDSAMDFESSLLNLKIDDNAFFDNAEELYWELVENILGKLNLDYIYQKEIEKIGIENIRVRNNQNSQPTNGVSLNKSQNQVKTGGLFSQETADKLPQPLFTQRHKYADKNQQETSENNLHEANLDNVNKKRCFGLFTRRRHFSTNLSTDAESVSVENTYHNENRNSGNIFDRPSTSKESKSSRSIENSQKSPVDKGKKRRANSPKKDKNEFKKVNKESIENEIDLLKQMPSVNDDFAKFKMVIDWDLEEDPEENSDSSSNLVRLQEPLQHSQVLLSSNKTGNVRDSNASVTLGESKARKTSLFSNFCFQPREMEKVDSSEIQRSSSSEFKSSNVEAEKVSHKVQTKETVTASQPSRFRDLNLDADYLELVSFNPFAKKGQPKQNKIEGAKEVTHDESKEELTKENSSSSSESKSGNVEAQKVSHKVVERKETVTASQPSRFRDLNLDAEYWELVNFNPFAKKSQAKEKKKDDSTKIGHTKEVNRNKESSSSSSEHFSHKAFQRKETVTASQPSRFRDLDLDADYKELVSFNPFAKTGQLKDKENDNSTKIERAKEVTRNKGKEELDKENSTSSSESKLGNVDAQKVSHKVVERKKTVAASQRARFRDLNLDAEYWELVNFNPFAKKSQAKEKKKDDSTKIGHTKEVNRNKESSSSSSEAAEAQHFSHKAFQRKETVAASQPSRFRDLDLDADYKELVSFNPFANKGQLKDKENDNSTKIERAKEVTRNKDKEELDKENSNSSSESKSGNVEAQKVSHEALQRKETVNASQPSRFRDLDLDADYKELVSFNPFAKKASKYIFHASSLLIQIYHTFKYAYITPEYLFVVLVVIAPETENNEDDDELLAFPTTKLSDFMSDSNHKCSPEPGPSTQDQQLQERPTKRRYSSTQSYNDEPLTIPSTNEYSPEPRPST